MRLALVRRTPLLAIASLAVLFASEAARAQSADAEASRLVREMATQLLSTAPHVGLSVAISRDGRTVFAEGFGYADLESRRPVTVNTRFRAASVSKVIAATALGRLMQERRIDLDAPVQRYVPTYPQKAHAITPRLLAGHISGLPHYTGIDRRENRFYGSVTDALSVFAHIPQQSPPRTFYQYSTHGFTLLSAAIEGAAGKPFLEYQEEAVLKPLGMTSTGPDLRAAPHPEMSTFYYFREGQLAKLTETEDPSYKWAGGGMTSTPSDLIKLANAYLNGFLSREVVTEMWQSQRLENGNETGVGLAWRRDWDFAGRPVMEHAGSMDGTRSVISIWPEQRAAASLMANREWSSAAELSAHMLALPFLDQRPRGAGITARADVTVEIMSAQGARRSVPGQLTMQDGRGTLVADSVTYQLIHVAAGNVYAFIRPQGIYHATLELRDGRISGRVIAYGSPQPRRIDPPNAVMTFSGALR